MDMTILFSDYFPENTHKQMKPAPVKSTKAQSSNEQDSSTDSNMVELDECVNLDSDSIATTNNNNMDQSLKQVLQTFFTDKKHDCFLKFELEHQIKLMARIFQRFLLDAKSLKTITNARCPVVRFMSNSTKIYCDVSLNN
jgi:DNA polymerase sigma